MSPAERWNEGARGIPEDSRAEDKGLQRAIGAQKNGEGRCGSGKQQAAGGALAVSYCGQCAAGGANAERQREDGEALGERNAGEGRRERAEHGKRQDDFSGAGREKTAREGRKQQAGADVGDCLREENGLSSTRDPQRRANIHSKEARMMG